MMDADKMEDVKDIERDIDIVGEILAESCKGVGSFDRIIERLDALSNVAGAARMFSRAVCSEDMRGTIYAGKVLDHALRRAGVEP